MIRSGRLGNTSRNSHTVAFSLCWCYSPFGLFLLCCLFFLHFLWCVCTSFCAYVSFCACLSECLLLFARVIFYTLALSLQYPYFLSPLDCSCSIWVCRVIVYLTFLFSGLCKISCVPFRPKPIRTISGVFGIN